MVTAERLGEGIVDGMVILTVPRRREAGTATGLEARDRMTGVLRWRYFSPSEPPLDSVGWKPVGGALVAGDLGGAETALDPATGREIELPQSVAAAASTGAGVAVTVADGEVTGRDIGTGKRRWSTSGTRDCPPGQAVMDDGGVTVLSSCDQDSVDVDMRDPANGERRWHQRIDSGPGPEGLAVAVALRPSTVVVSTPRLVSVHDRRDGRPLWSQRGDEVCLYECTSVEVSGVLAVATTKAVIGVDVRSGRVRWQVSADHVSTLFAGGDAVHALDSLGEDHLPAWLRIIEAGTGRQTLTPLPFARRGLSWLGYTDGMLYALSMYHGGDPAHAGLRSLLAAYRLTRAPGRPEHSGAAVTGWPNACEMGSAARPGVLFHTRYSRAPRRTTLPGDGRHGSLSCDFLPESQSSPVIRITDAWVAPTAVAARELVATYTAEPQTLTPVAGIGDEAYELSTDSVGGTKTGTVLLRVGRVILRVEALQQPAAARRMAAAVAARLEGRR